MDSTLVDLLITLEQVVSMANSGQRVKLLWNGNWVWWQFSCDQPGQTTYPQSNRYDVGLYLSALRQVLGSEWRPTELHLKGTPCRTLLRLDDFAGTTIHFLRPYNAIKIPRAALSLPYNPTATSTDSTTIQTIKRFGRPPQPNHFSTHCISLFCRCCPTVAPTLLWWPPHRGSVCGRYNAIWPKWG